MKTSNKKEPQVNPPKMTSHDLSDAEMEIRELIAKRESGQTSDTENINATSSDPNFHMNANGQENLS